MFVKLVSLLHRFKSCQDGVTLVEYGIALALAIGLGLAAFTPLVDDITGSMTAAGAPMPNP
jgi:pilus assembly protein Flp/PilA